jgi:hypothetical protein
LEQAQADIAAYQAAVAPARKTVPLWIPGAIATVAAVILLILQWWISGGLLGAAGVACLLLQMVQSRQRQLADFEMVSRQQAIVSRYGGGTPEAWLAQASAYDRLHREYEQQLQQHTIRRQQAMDAIARWDRELEQATEGRGYSSAVAYYSDAKRQRDALEDASRRFADARKHAENMAAMAKPVEKPDAEDFLTDSLAETDRRLEENRREIHALQQRFGHLQGLMESAGQEQRLRSELEAVNARLDRLAETYAALELAQATLASATAQLQSRFAPRITKEAQSLLGRMTGGRYDRLTISQDMSLSVAAQEETVLRESQRRSEGTVDQIYLALRLAVSRELMPHAPFILDDALVRFDNTRHAAAMEILQEEAASRQIILFTCQTRESA